LLKIKKIDRNFFEQFALEIVSQSPMRIGSLNNLLRIVKRNEKEEKKHELILLDKEVKISKVILLTSCNTNFQN
jgi:AAA+ superfamily predicted ATPase